MTVFIHPERRCMVLASCKVMTRTLADLPQLTEFKVTRTRDVLQTMWFTDPRYLYDAYWLARNPYQRLQSCFRQKFSMFSAPDPIPWQKILLQKKVLKRSAKLSSQKHLDISVCSDDELRQKISTLDFEDFIATLPACHPYNAHIWPQYWVEHPYLTMTKSFLVWEPANRLLRRWRRHFWSLMCPQRYPKIKKLRILHVENTNDLTLLGRAIGCDLSAPEHHKNRTAHVDSLQEKIRYSRQSLAIVNEVYREDFLRLGYRMYSDPKELESTGAFAPIQP